MNKGKKNIQQILSFLLLAFTLCAVLWIGLKGNDLQDLAAALEKLSFGIYADLHFPFSSMHKI